MPIYFTLALTLFNMISFAATRMLVTLYALELGSRPVMVGLLGATFAVFPMLLSWPVGKACDRYGARLPLTLGAAIGAGGLVLPYFLPTLPIVFVAAALSGMSATLFIVSLQYVVGKLSSAENRARNYSNYSMIIAGANTIGPLLAGFSIDEFGHAITFIFVAAVLVLPFAMLARWGGMLPGGSSDRGPSRGFRHTLMNPKIWPVIAASSIAQCGLELFQVYVPVYAHSLALSASAIGTIVAMCAVGGFLGRLLLTQLIELAGEEKVLAYALFLGAISFIVVPFFKTALVLSIIAFVFGFGLNCTQPVALMLMYSRSPEGRSGEALGLRFAFDHAAKVAGPIVFGMVASAVSVAAVFWTSALLLGGGGIVTNADAKRK